MSLPTLQQKYNLIDVLQKLDQCMQLSSPTEANTILMELIKSDVDFGYLTTALKYADVNCGNSHESNPLMYACYNKKFPLVQFLVEKGGADVNKQSNGNSTPIMYSFQQNDFQTFMYLLSKGVALRTEKHGLGEYIRSGEEFTKFMESLCALIPMNNSGSK